MTRVTAFTKNMTCVTAFTKTWHV